MHPSKSNSAFSSLGEEFSWQAGNFAAIYNADCVDTVHLLLAAAEVTPVELHGYQELTPVAISKTLAALQFGTASERLTKSLPRRLTKRSQEFVRKVMRFASRTDRNPSLRDIWVALSREEDSSISAIFEGLGIDRGELYRRVSGS